MLTSAHKVMTGLLIGKDTPAFIPFKDRRTFAAGTNEANALLGTPTGVGVLWMLLRQPHLTGKVVKSVSIFGRLGFRLESAKERRTSQTMVVRTCTLRSLISARDAVAAILTCDKTV